MNKRHLIAAVVILPLLLGATSEECAPKPARGGGITINQDDGEHLLHNYGRIRFDKILSPHGAGAACKWRLEAQFKGEKGRHRIDNGTETEKIYVRPPASESTKVWLISKSCGKWE
jgi:hypothetical protein